jgi:hypothetical protein
MRNLVLASLVGVLLLPAAALDAQPKDGYTLKDVAWFVGGWRNPASDKTLYEEHWSDPAGGAMVGMFRLVNPGKSALYELLLLEETPDGVFMRLRHFKAGMAELEKEPIRLKLVKASASEAVFENPDNEKPKRITYRLNEGQMAVTVETIRDGKAASFTLKMDRMKK